MFKNLIFVAAFTLLTTGCAPNVNVAQSLEASPGPDLIPPSYAGNFFTEICLTTAPSFSGVPRAIAGEPFVQHTGTGTYYHKYADLSIKVSEYGCSLVFRSEMSIDDTIAELAKGTAKNLENWGLTLPDNLDITSYASPRGNGRYFRIGAPRS